MRDYRIITDSICDIPEYWLEGCGNDIIIIPTPITRSDGYSFAGISIEDLKELVDGCKAYNMKITTSSPSLIEVKNAIVKTLKSGKNALYITMAKSLSSTFDHVAMLCHDINGAFAEQGSKERAYCVDGEAVTGGLGLLVQQTYLHNTTIEGAMAYVENRAPRISHLFTVKNFDQLHQSGRIKKIHLYAAGILDIRPIMGFEYNENHKKEGVLLEKVRGEKKAYSRMAEIVAAEASILTRIIIGYGYNLKSEAKSLAEAIKQALPGAKIETDWRIGPEVGCHVGPEAIGVFYEKAGR